jgi:hypothetical protein
MILCIIPHSGSADTFILEDTSIIFMFLMEGTRGTTGRTTVSCSLKNCGKTFLEEGSDRCCDGVLLLTQEMILTLDQLQGASRIDLVVFLGI